MSRWRNLVFKGGGIKGLAYIGALKVLEARGALALIRRVAGTSSGAMCATFLALGASPWDMARIVLRTRFDRFMDASVWPGGNIRRLLTDYGWFKGDVLHRWVRMTVASLTGDGDLTFAGLAQLRSGQPDRFRDLSIVAADFSAQAPVVFNARRSPGMPVSLALRTAMGIPLFYGVQRGPGGELLGDGGLLWNYPLSMYDAPEESDQDDGLASAGPHARRYNPETLGLMVETRRSARSAQVAPGTQIEHFSEYLRSILGLMTDLSQSAYLSPEDWKRTVFIEALGVRATDFRISVAGMERLMESGEQAVDAFFDCGKAD